VSSVSSSSFSYALTAPNVVSVAVSPVGIATALRLDEINCEINEIPKLGTLTINAFGGITN
jgi:hypothetical protein